MPRSKKRTRDEVLKEKREAERLRYQKIMNDPVLKAEQQLKEREKYRKKREKRTRKVKGEMSKREHRQMKKKWKQWNKTRKIKQEKEKKITEYMNQHSPPESPPSIFNRSPPSASDLLSPSLSPPSSDLGPDRSLKQNSHPAYPSLPNPGTSRNESLRKVGRRKIARNKSKVYRENIALKREVNNLRTKMERYKKRAYRTQQKTPSSTTESPGTKVNKLLRTGNREQIRKRLIFSESMLTAFKISAAHKKSKKAMNILLKNMENLKKYKMLTFNKTFRQLLYAKRNQRQNSLLSSKISKINGALRHLVKEFYERDDVSRVCAGKKECITLKRIKKQKRYLLDSLQNLHKKFLESVSLKLSYSAFCSLRPFWVLIPKVKDREMCLCTTHENFSLLIEVLKKHDVLRSKDSKMLISEICCEQPKSTCFYRTCPNCEDKSVLLGTFDGAQEVTYFAWTRKEETFVDKKTGKTRVVKKIKKEQLTDSLYNIVQKFLLTVDVFLQHEGNLRHQYTAISELKRRLTPNECLIHADFSENYSMKLSREVQSFHFGGSREQYSLHTVVVYYRRDMYSPVIHKSICTVSKCLEHGPAAIWCHLVPVFEFLKRQTTTIETVHFLTDGPTSQYKNKTIFFLLCSALKAHFEHLKKATWNYSESGHGKGAADGVGGFLKRTADRLVSQGIDITDFETFVKLLQENTRRILVQVIDEEEIQRTKQCIPTLISSFPGTMKVHQVVYQIMKPEELQMKSLSCFNCLNCSSYLLGIHKPSPKYPQEAARVESEFLVSSILMTPCEDAGTLNPRSNKLSVSNFS